MNDLGFIRGARLETMRRDFDRLRQAIRAHDSFATEEAWENCERWVCQLSVVSDLGPAEAHEQVLAAVDRFAGTA